MNRQEILGPAYTSPEPKETQETYTLAIPLINYHVGVISYL